MNNISRQEFARLCAGIYQDREVIYKHNPIGTREEVLLWMLLCCLNSYLSLSENEMPCFNGKPDASTYRNAILYVLENRRSDEFDAENYLDEMLEETRQQ